MGDLTIDQNGEEKEPVVEKTNSPLVISLGCVLLLLALFVAVLEAEGQTATSTRDVAFGSISGRVTTVEVGKQLAGVRILVRRVHAGVANFYFDRITAADGSFEFKALLPGRYAIEIDPRTIADGDSPVLDRVTLVDVAANVTSRKDIAISLTSHRPEIAKAAGQRKD
jgi:hypothetical protein